MQTRRSRGAKRPNEADEARSAKIARQSDANAETRDGEEMDARPRTRSRAQQNSHPDSFEATLDPTAYADVDEEELDEDFDEDPDLHHDSCSSDELCHHCEEGPLPRLSSEPLLPPRDCERIRSRVEYETPYAKHIFAHLRIRESNMRASSNYMDRQPDLDANMRGILIDWLVEVAEEYKLRSESVFMAVSVLDRLLDRMEVKKDDLQLVGVASMHISAKLEEHRPPSVEDFVYISDHTYTTTEILDMEKKILFQLDHKILAPTAYVFVRRYQDAGRADEEVIQLSNYLCELTVLEYSFLKYEPSMIAASAVALALWTAECEPWSPTLEHYSGFKLSDLKECLENLLNLYVEAGTGQLQAVREKYSAPNPHLCVANMPPPEAIPSDATATSPSPPAH